MKSMLNRTAVAILVCVPLVSLTGAPALADDDDLPPFPKDVLADPAAIKAGHETFDKICKFCHGKSAYPGKAPKLNPKRYTPEFVFDRVTNGFRGMASYKEALSEQERQAVTAYIMSKEFSN